ncbi:MAG: hypothetical protein ACKOYJ_01240 [Planctomycetia bacterium]
MSLTRGGGRDRSPRRGTRRGFRGERRRGRTIHLDPQGNVGGDAEAEALLTRPCRSPWQLPTPESV